jgi:hypothetical protein
MICAVSQATGSQVVRVPRLERLLRGLELLYIGSEEMYLSTSRRAPATWSAGLTPLSSLKTVVRFLVVV